MPKIFNKVFDSLELHFIVKPGKFITLCFLRTVMFFFNLATAMQQCRHNWWDFVMPNRF